MSLMDYVVDEFEREDLQSSHKGHTVLLYKNGEFLYGVTYSKFIPASVFIDAINIAQHTFEADKVVIVLEDGRRVSKKFDK